MTEGLFMGKSYGYWIEVSRRLELGPDALEVDHLLHELITANAKVRYYELQLKRMNDYRDAADK